mmetsp:Transcript_16468/g.36993  ORF Transcript_16468/g.36993 Transcript_16468/m.36993 type:complete len:409 (+) Transcript_16468:305-1531(+)
MEIPERKVRRFLHHRNARAGPRREGHGVRRDRSVGNAQSPPQRRNPPHRRDPVPVADEALAERRALPPGRRRRPRRRPRLLGRRAQMEAHAHLSADRSADAAHRQRVSARYDPRRGIRQQGGAGVRGTRTVSYFQFPGFVRHVLFGDVRGIQQDGESRAGNFGERSDVLRPRPGRGGIFVSDDVQSPGTFLERGGRPDRNVRLLFERMEKCPRDRHGEKLRLHGPRLGRPLGRRLSAPVLPRQRPPTAGGRGRRHPRRTGRNGFPHPLRLSGHHLGPGQLAGPPPGPLPLHATNPPKGTDRGDARPGRRNAGPRDVSAGQDSALPPRGPAREPPVHPRHTHQRHQEKQSLRSGNPRRDHSAELLHPPGQLFGGVGSGVRAAARAVPAGAVDGRRRRREEGDAATGSGP